MHVFWMRTCACMSLSLCALIFSARTSSLLPWLSVFWTYLFLNLLHLLLDFSLDCYIEERVPTKTSEKLNFFKGDYVNINNQLLLIDWQQELDGLNLLQSWDRFAEKSVNLITNNIPVSKSTPEGKKSNPFITRSCLEAIKQKRTRWLKYKFFKTDSTFNKYKAARNTVTTN